MYTKDDVGDVPGREPLTDDEKQVIVDAWNVENAKPPEPVQPTLQDVIDMLEAEQPGRADAIRAMADARR